MSTLLSAQIDTDHNMVWPNFFITGTVKGGTTSLYRHLQKHPDVFFPEFKEPHYFAQIQPEPEKRNLIEYISEQKDYLRLYKDAAGFCAIGDASTSNLWYPKAPERIFTVAPEARIIILLRDPVSRAHSHYLMDFREGLVDAPFSVELLQEDYEKAEKGWGVSHLYVDLGLYYEQVQRYLQIFGPQQVLVLQFSDLVQDPDQTLHQVALHLGIDPAPFAAIDSEQVYNGYKAPRGKWSRRCAPSPMARWIGYHLMPRKLQWWLYQNLILKAAAKPSMDPTVRRYLETLYTPDIEKLEGLLGRQLPGLKSSWGVLENLRT